MRWLVLYEFYQSTDTGRIKILSRESIQPNDGSATGTSSSVRRKTKLAVSYSQGTAPRALHRFERLPMAYAQTSKDLRRINVMWYSPYLVHVPGSAPALHNTPPLGGNAPASRIHIHHLERNCRWCESAVPPNTPYECLKAP